MSQTTVDKFICWSCMKPTEQRIKVDNIKMVGKAITAYYLGDCCKELSTEVMHKDSE